ncbi:MAG TPA: S8 family serine peptidase [Pyrinomonadaceae bacterium]
MSRSLFIKMSLLTIVIVMLLTSLAAGDLLVRTFAAPVGVIVQLKSDPVVVAKAAAESRGQSFDLQEYRRQIIAEQELFLDQLRAAGIDFSIANVDAPNGPNGEVANIQFRYNYVLNGLALSVPSSAVDSIKKMGMVKSVHKDEPISMHLDNGVKYTRAPSLYGQPPQIKMGDALATGGFHGEGINIAIVDTGIEWQHPMFGGDPTPPQFGVGPAIAAVGPNRKVPYYLNLTAGAVTDDFGHGSHVAGIAAGYLSKAPGPDGLPLTADDVSIHGVAPQAKLMGYKALSSVGVGVAHSIIMAVEDAVQPFTLAGYPKPVAHVINLSLGAENVNDPDYPTSIACDNATLAGTTVVASAGNSGRPTPAFPTGEGTIGSPGSGRRVLTVGASLDPGSAPNSVDEVGGDNRTGMKAFPLDGSAPIVADVINNYVFCGLAETPDQVPDSVRGKIALIERGGTVNTSPPAPSAGTGLFSNKAAFALAKGAIAVIIYNNVPGELTASTVRKSTVPVVGMSQANGQYLRNAIGSTAFGAISTHQIRLNKLLLFEPDMADFSSKGPVLGFGMIKPDVTAPGVSVLSATVRVGAVAANTSTMFDPTGYISASGTSMSSPMTAGVVALVKQKNPSWTPSMIRAAVMNTATNLRRADGTPIPDGVQTVNQHGAGHVDAFAAANAKALMGVGHISSSEPVVTARTHGVFVSSSPGNPDFLGSHSFGAVPIAGVIGTNTKTQAVTITDVSNGQGGGVYAISSSTVRNMPSGVSVTFTDGQGNSITSVEVPAGGIASFNVNIAVNGESVPANPTQIEWYVTAARTDGGQTLRMPFQYRAVAPTVALFAPILNDAGGVEFAGHPATDINGNYQITYAATGETPPAQFRIEESNDGATWSFVADVPASQTSYGFAGRGNGTFNYRVRSLYAVEDGFLPGPSSGFKTVVVDRRLEADITSAIEARMVDGTLSFSGGVFQFDQILRNTSSTSVFAPMKMIITSVSSGSGNVRVANADDGGNGVSAPASFDYTSQVGADQQLGTGESTASRRIQFNNPASEMFQFTVVVRGHLPDSAGAATGGGTSGGDGTGAGASGGGTSGSESTSGSGATTGSGILSGVQLRFLVNPLTRSVSLVK